MAITTISTSDDEHRVISYKVKSFMFGRGTADDYEVLEIEIPYEYSMDEDLRDGISYFNRNNLEQIIIDWVPEMSNNNDELNEILALILAEMKACGIEVR